ncbi:uncharacterized protein [Argopecten irradians]|uniref:uncharacterized protein n=1 Tax=Argopecten irradians TaxID=31199 RepID=UPI00371523C2
MKDERESKEHTGRCRNEGLERAKNKQGDVGMKDERESKEHTGRFSRAPRFNGERPLPTTWLKLELDIFKKREKGTKILTLAEVIEMNKSSIAPLENEDEMMLALEYLHCTRSVIYFREYKYVVCDPQWLADFFSIFLTEECFLPKDDLLLTRDLTLYNTKGELTQAMIDGLLGLEKNQAFLPFRSVLFALMEKFGLIVKLPLTETSTGQPTLTDTYTIPSKLMELQDISNIEDIITILQQRNCLVSKTLCLVFEGFYIPDELFQRIFANVLRKYRSEILSAMNLQETTCEPTSDNSICLYNGFGCFEVNDLCRMILSMHVERSTIALTVFSTTESSLPSDSGRHVRTSIEQIVAETLQMSNQKHFKFKHHLHCSCYLGSYDTPVHLYGVINSERGVPCKGGDCHGKHRLAKSDAIFWDIKEVSGNTHKDENASRIGIATISNRRPTPQELGRLSRLVDASQCDRLFVELGLPLPEVQQTKFEARSLAGITVITKMFLKWTNTYPNQTLFDIKEAMATVDMATDRINEVLEKNEDLTDQDIVPIDVWTRAPSDEEIKRIVPNIGNTFYNLCLELGLSPPIIEQHEIGHPITFQSRMCTLLQCWVDEFQTDATIGRLLTAMKACRIDWYTTAQILSQESGVSESSEDRASCFRCGIL